MRTTEERLARLEGRVTEQSQMFDSLRTNLVQFEERVDRRFAEFEECIDRRFTDFEQRVDRRFEQVDRRFEQVESRLTHIEQKLDRELGAIRHDMAVQFRWTMGLMFTGFVTVVAAVVAT